MYTVRRVFDWMSHERFARISCDYNPIHMDPVAARRTHAGAPIVHGIHSLIWILECFARSEFCTQTAKSLKAQFLQPIYVGDEVVLEFSKPTPRTVRARITIGAEEVMVASIGSDETKNALAIKQEFCSEITNPPDLPSERGLEKLEGLTGNLSFGPTVSGLDELVPSAVQLFSRQRIAALVATSCLVGMIAPGLHSMYLSLDVSLSANIDTSPGALHFHVASVIARFRLVRITVAAQGVQGSLEAMSRMPPTKQASMNTALSLVSRNEFRNSVALVIGGSRGLGELTSKLVAAGSGQVIITYAAGKSDADAVSKEIEQAGSRCRSITYDIHRPVAEQLIALSTTPTHVYYFATPRIYRRRSELFDVQRFNEFNAFYVSAFFDLIRHCSRLRPDGLRVFYPSSTFIDVRPAEMTEYAMSKVAAEQLCADLPKLLPGVQVLMRRLPRLPTDQNSSVAQAQVADPIEVMLPIVREMHRQS